ncbi:hypothetical protein SAMN05444487_111103 [Marininema mesophilum]|uniref:Uncharacterized protein n=1 Tax=Marininema mesophilum TaxID=1048340 RepID=A0A1H2ZLP1_9BACL|nr:hypothetical protein SAMN05444487_111103 [Marininema mesophilum]
MWRVTGWNEDRFLLVLEGKTVLPLALSDHVAIAEENLAGEDQDVQHLAAETAVIRSGSAFSIKNGFY